jgi:hypothetical protein
LSDFHGFHIPIKNQKWPILGLKRGFSGVLVTPEGAATTPKRPKRTTDRAAMTTNDDQ